MSNDIDESSPLLQFPGANGYYHNANLGDAYKQFCHLIGKPSDQPAEHSHHPASDTLYRRATQHRRTQNVTYQFTAALINTMLLMQVVLGAALTALGASDSSRALITVFGVLNTVIAGLIAFLKSRGQPMRARMFRDDLERVVDEIENSAIMWQGISSGAHGYDEIDTDNSVTVRSEVARLTRLYDRAVRTNTLNDPDFYGGGGNSDPHGAALRTRTGQNITLPAMPPSGPPAENGAASAPAPIIGPAADPDESPATKAPTPPSAESPKEAAKDDAKDSVKDRNSNLLDDKAKSLPSDGKREPSLAEVNEEPISLNGPTSSKGEGNKPADL